MIYRGQNQRRSIIMPTKKATHLEIYIVITAVIFSACATPSTQIYNVPANSTGVIELDKIIDIVLRGDTNELKSVIRLTQTNCTFADGLGGPPKCLGKEQEGAIVEVLPILDSEGHFLRKDELESWDGLEVSALFAVYEAAKPIYVDENYPSGKYAIVFIGKDKNTNITLRVDQGSIVRIDYGFGSPPAIREDEVVRYLIQPIDVIP